MILRQPLYAALTEAGHDLTLIVRPLVLPLMRAIAPRAKVLSLPVDPYHGQLDAAELKNLVEQVSASQPDLFLVASFQWTPFEEFLADALPGVRRAGMTGRLFPGDPRLGVRYQSRMTLDMTADVLETTPELRKNELLCSTVLGRDVKLPPPRLTATDDQLSSAQAVLQRMGLDAGDYWVACVGHHEHTRVRNWSTANWGRTLSHWGRAYGRRFVLVGTESEADAGRDVIAAMDDDCRSAATQAEGLDLDTLLGLTSLSRGYVGRDTGPMHLAAAVGKPVLAVFGGGTWPRFLPAAEPSHVLTVGVPCAGCDWICHLPESYCVKAIPVERVVAAIDDLEQGRTRGAEVTVIDAGPVLLSRMVEESAHAAREATFRASQTARDRDALAPVAAELEQARAQTEQARADAERAEADTKRARAEVDQVRTQVDQARAEAERARAEANEARTETNQMWVQAEALQSRLRNELAMVNDLKLKLTRTGAEQDTLATFVQQAHAEREALTAEVREARAEADRLWQQSRKLEARIERLGRSKWHRLGLALGLKLDSMNPAGESKATSKGATAPPKPGALQNPAKPEHGK